ncbi:MAG: hypothetical protein ACR2KK_22455 [Acidimicrobiales bacterium]
MRRSGSFTRSLAAAGEYTVFGWDDARMGTELASSQDIHARAVQFEAPGGLLLLAVALAACRRQSPMPAAREKQPAGTS